MSARFNFRIWGGENLRVFLEHVHDGPKMNVFCPLSRRRVYGPFFFVRMTIAGTMSRYTSEVISEMLRSMWQEIDYRWDVCRIANGSHIEQ
jgi:hypothetical protein